MREVSGEPWFLVDGQWCRGWVREAAGKAARKLLNVGPRRGYGLLELSEARPVPPDFRGAVSEPVEVA